MITFDQFKEYYQKWGKCINDVQPRTRPMSDVQLEKRYKLYVMSEEKKLDKLLVLSEKGEKNNDSKWYEVSRQALIRDNFQCRILSIMNSKQEKTFKEDMKIKGELSLINILDVAHIISRSKCPKLKYELDNLVVLNRYSHYMMDQHRHPLNGEYIYDDEIKSWWMAIVGKAQYVRLGEKIKELGIKEELF
jgi:hypothetical protein